MTRCFLKEHIEVWDLRPGSIIAIEVGEDFLGHHQFIATTTTPCIRRSTIAMKRAPKPGRSPTH